MEQRGQIREQRFMASSAENWFGLFRILLPHVPADGPRGYKKLSPCKKWLIPGPFHICKSNLEQITLVVLQVLPLQVLPRRFRALMVRVFDHSLEHMHPYQVQLWYPRINLRNGKRLKAAPRC